MSVKSFRFPQTPEGQRFGRAMVEAPRDNLPEPTYKLCPRCGEPIEAEIFSVHARNCDGSIHVPPATTEEWESVSARAERLSDRHLRYDGSERGRR